MTAYKESGIKWLGKIPAHWEVARVKDIFYLFKDISYIENPTVLSLTRDGVKVRDMSNLKGQFAENYNNYNKVKVGDLLLNVMDLYSGANCNVSQVDGVISPAYANLRQHKECYPKYFDYYFKMQYISKAFQAAGKGVSYEHRWTLTSEVLLNYPIPLPPLEEQRKIADFLDKKLEKIDYFIAKQTKFIELLKEQKQVLINQATTKGLDKSTELKDTHISHLGKIPTHWEVVKLGKICSVSSGGTPSRANNKYWENGTIKWLGSTVCKNTKFVECDCEYITQEGLENSSAKIFHTGTILLALVGATIGKIAYLNFDAATNQNIAGIVPLNKNILSNNYLFYCLLTSYPCFVEQSNNDFHMANLSFVRELLIVLPPLEEQEKIAKYLDDKCEKIDKAINNITKQISLIQEYKTSLIDTTTKGMLKELK